MPETSPANDLRDVRAASRQGRSGEPIPEHRSLRTLSFSPSKLAVVLLLPVAFNVVTWLSLHPIARAWRVFFAFWIERLALEGKASFIPRGPESLAIPLPYVELLTRMPDAVTWWTTLAVTAIALLAAPSIPERWLPMRYLLRVVLFIQITALLFFVTVPAAFPYSLPQYIVSSLQTAVWFMLVLPWVHALVYYIFDFSLAQKARLTALTLAFVAAALPFQLMVHGYLLVKGSMLLMPSLYLVFGIWLLVFPCVALYGWAMSWPRGGEARRARAPSASSPRGRGGDARVSAGAASVPARTP